MSKQHVFFLFVVFFLFAGCRVDRQTTAYPPEDSKPVATLTRIPAAPTGTTTPTAVRPMKTPPPTDTPAPTPSPTITPSPTPTSEPFTYCQDIIYEQLPDDFMSDGAIIFEGECEGVEGLYKLSSATRKLEPFLADVLDHQYRADVVGNQYLGPYHVSPDQEWLAFDYTYTEGNGVFLNLIVVSRDDERSVITYPGGGIVGWFGSQHLGLPTGAYAPDKTLAIVNPFSGEKDYVFYPHDWRRRHHSYFAFDPQFERGAYSDDTKHNAEAILRDLKNDRVLWWKQVPIANDAALWAPDGSKFALAIWDSGYDRFRFSLVSREGEETVIDIPFEVSVNQRFGWTPDSKYLVFWEFMPEAESGRLIFIDTVSHQLIDFGINGRGGLPEFSPDQQQFVLSARVSNSHLEDEESSVLLFDRMTEDIVQLKLGLYPVGWLKLADPETVVEVNNEAPPPLPPSSTSLVQQKCLAVGQTDNFQLLSDGGIVFFYDGQPYTITSTDGIRELPNAKKGAGYGWTDAAVSPNGQWLAYTYRNASGDNRLWITDIDGQQTLDATFPEIFHSFKGWFNDRQVFLYWRFDRLIGRLDLLDPFEGVLQELASTDGGPMVRKRINEDLIPLGRAFIRQCDRDCKATWSSIFNEVYDRSFERIVYFFGPSKNEMPSIRLFNMETVQDVWEYEHWHTTINEPIWSPDEQQFAVTLPMDERGEHYEIFMVDRDGRPTQLTNFANAYPVAVVGGFQWSPDGRYIAFWMDTRPVEGQMSRAPYRLFVLDIAKRLVTDYCVYGQSIVWSPDSRQIAVNSNSEGLGSQIILIDIVDEFAVQLGEGTLVGWMSNNP